METFVILHNIRSTHNVGSIFRTADGAGVSKIYLTGYTPAPVDRFGRNDPSILKTALGATDSVPWEVQEDIISLIKKLKAEGIEIIAVEQHPKAISLSTWKQTKDSALIFGNEVDGVPIEVSELSDAIVHIPMQGMKESLNVSVCAGIVLFNKLTE